MATPAAETTSSAATTAPATTTTTSNPGPTVTPLAVPTPSRPGSSTLRPPSTSPSRRSGVQDQQQLLSPVSPRRSIDTSRSALSSQSRQNHRDYLDSLVPPSAEEFDRIAHVQQEREEEDRLRERRRRRESSGEGGAAHAHRRHAHGGSAASQSRSPTKAAEGRLHPDDAAVAGGESAATDSADERPSSKHSDRSSRSQRSSRSHAAWPVFAHHHGGSSSNHHHAASGGSGIFSSQQHRAATVIQRHYRGYRARREMKGLGLDASTRWAHAIREAQWREATRPRARSDVVAEDGPEGGAGVVVVSGAEEGAAAAGGSAPVSGAAGGLTPHTPTSPAATSAAARQNWRKVTAIAKRAGGDMDGDDASGSDDGSDSDSSSSSSSSAASDSSQKRRKAEAKAAERRAKREANREQRNKDAKMMGLQYFLEMVDLKHRYGSNLRVYHEEWLRANTNENFFYWLDHGEGRLLDVGACPRDRLEREQVRYLSREERQYYLVTVDKEGRLVWAKNGARIDTTEKYRDSVHGVVPVDDPTPSYVAPNAADLDSTGDGSGSGSSIRSSGESAREADRAAKYATPSFDDAHGVVKKVHAVSAATIFNKLLRKSVRKNTWIFVADTSFRLYVGIKNSGAFQHSSFLQGGRISAAGLIKIRRGRLTALSPLSGHYRPPAANFRAFVHSLKEAGVDMGRVRLSKSYAVLVGLEAYVKTKQRGKEALRKLKHGKDKTLHPEETRKKDEDKQDKSKSAAREREVLREEDLERERNSTAVKVMQMMGVTPVTEPEGQKGEGAAGEAKEEKPTDAGEKGRQEEAAAGIGPESTLDRVDKSKTVKAEVAEQMGEL